MTSIKSIPEGERPREKMIQLGSSSLSNAELLALLISNGNREDSALSLALAVLSLAEGSLRDLSNCRPEEYMTIRGIGEAYACRIAAAVELGRRMASVPPRQRIKLGDPDSTAALFMEEMRHLQQEKMRVAMINTKGELIAREDVSLGGIYSASASPREIFASAVRKGAYAVVLAHNHPSGDPSPSAADISVTRQIADAGRLLGIQLVDHIIIGDGIFVSLKQMGVF